MDPHYEQKLRDEVVYLHSLWHKGPPPTHHYLQPTQSTHFKKNKLKTNNNNNNNTKEGPCPPQHHTHQPKRPEPNTSISLSPDEKSKTSSHQNAITAAHKFFLDDDFDVIDDEEEDLMMEESDGKDEYGFFYKLFTDDTELREHYVKNFIQGEFCCLVCGAVGGRGTGKRFKSCLALVQHSITISNTKRRRSHRAFAQAVCKVLGWDIDRLPAIVSLLSEFHFKPEEEQVSVDLANKESSTVGVVGTSDVIVSLSSDNISEDAHGNVKFDNKEDLLTSTVNVDAIEGTNGGVVQDSGGVYVLSEHTSDNDGVVVSESGAVVSMLIEHTSEHNEIPESSAVVSMLNEHASVDNDISGRSLDSGAIVSMLHERTSEDNGIVPESGAIVSLLNENASDNNGIMPESGAVVSMQNEALDNNGGVVKGDGDEHTSEEAHAVNFDKESSTTSFCNFDSVEGNGGGVVPESGATGIVIMPAGDQGIVNSLTNANAGMARRNNSEESAVKGLITNSLTNSDVGMTQPNSEDLVATGLINAGTDDNNGVDNEMHELQMDGDVGLNRLKEGNLAEN